MTAALLMAALSLYGLGVPIAWLLPAPAHSPWCYRIAVAPLLAIVAAGVGAAVLSWFGLPLHPVALIVLGVSCWVLAWWSTGPQWHVRRALANAATPASVVTLAALTWASSLAGFGLYLPNRDFKNHAYFVAQVAWSRSADLSLVLRPAPTSDPVGSNFYPIGLHTLLGWALPSTTSNAVGLTAAAAVLVCAVSTPLGFIVLARMWQADAPWHPALAGVTAVVMPGMTAPFGIGGVALLAGAALYAVALVGLWMWVREPTLRAAAAVALIGLGLFALHVAEAVGFGMLALACLPVVVARNPGLLARRTLVVALACLVGAVLGLLLVSDRLLGLLAGGFDWELQPNELDPVMSLGAAIVQQPGGWTPVALVWVVMALVGFWLAHVRGLSRFMVLAFAVPVVLAFLSVASVVPDWLNTLTAPWYGSAARVGLMAAAPVALAASLSLASLVVAAGKRPWRLATAVAVVAVALGAMAVQIVPQRRFDLRAGLAGAGDSLQIARQLVDKLEPGKAVLNLEGDGTANLFAYARVPVLAGLDPDPAVDAPSTITADLLRLSDPAVQAELDRLGVQFIALGVTSVYWDAGVGYVWQEVAQQPEVAVSLVGSDMVVLEYRGSKP